MRNILAAIAASLLVLIATPAHAQEAKPVRVLFVGNSLTYVNNMPRLLHALAAVQPGKLAITTNTWAAPGGSLEQRWSDGHVAKALADGHWDVLVLQERTAEVACLTSAASRRPASCRISERVYHQFAKLAAANGTRVLLLSTWGMDRGRRARRGNSMRGQDRLDAAFETLAARLRADDGAKVDVVPAGHALRAWADEREDPTVVFPDGLHPSVAASLVIAAQIYHAITGEDAQANDLPIDFPLLPADALVKADKPLEDQTKLADDAGGGELKAATLAPYLKVARDGSK